MNMLILQASTICTEGQCQGYILQLELTKVTETIAPYRVNLYQM